MIWLMRVWVGFMEWNGDLSMLAILEAVEDSLQLVKVRKYLICT
jgi:hypothetical protein